MRRFLAHQKLLSRRRLLLQPSSPQAV
jgi:hypothetical protein